MNLGLILRGIYCLCEIEISKPVIKVSPVAPPEGQNYLVFNHFVASYPEKRLSGLSNLSDHLHVVVFLAGLPAVPII